MFTFNPRPFGAGVSLLGALLLVHTSCSTEKPSGDQDSPIPLTIMGHDNRTAALPAVYPFSAVGRLSVSDSTMCSTWLVGPRLAMTAAHCVVDKDTRQIHKSLVYEAQVGTPNAQTSTATVLQVGTYEPLKNFEQDWAILQLDKDLGNTYGFFGVRGVTQADIMDKQSSNPGYAAPEFQLTCFNSDLDGGRKLTSTITFLLGTFASGALQHNGDMKPGCSGGPLWTYGGPDGKAAVAVAMNVFESLKDGAPQAIGDPLSETFANGAVTGATFVQAIENHLRSTTPP